MGSSIRTNILHQEPACGDVQGCICRESREPDAEIYDERYGEDRDDAGHGSKRDGQGHVSSGYFGENVGGTSSGGAGNQHDAGKYHRVRTEYQAQGERYEREDDKLSRETGNDGCGSTGKCLEIARGKGEAEVKHQHGEDRKYYKNRIHSNFNLGANIAGRLLFAAFANFASNLQLSVKIFL